MKFTALHQINFGTALGAYSEVTPREYHDSQITLDDTESSIIFQAIGKQAIHRGNVRSNPSAASQNFILDTHDGEKKISLNLVYPKPEKDELRLYLRKDLFKPGQNEIWFLYAKDGEVHLGSQSLETWRTLGRSDPEDQIYQSLVVPDHSEDLPPEYRLIADRVALKRNPKLAKARFVQQEYQCQISGECRGFVSRSSNKNYLEAHHFIPLVFQPLFETSLDRIENIVGLCPFCHRAIHHAQEDFTRKLITEILPSTNSLFEIFPLVEDDIFSLYNCESFEPRSAS